MSSHYLRRSLEVLLRLVYLVPSGGIIVVVEVDSASFGLEASTGYKRYTYLRGRCAVGLLSVYEKRSGLIGSCT